jgi:hexosaminidase
MKLHLAGILFSLLTATGLAADVTTLSILPVPQKMVAGTGAFKLAPDTRICTDAASRASGEFVAAQLHKSTGYKFEVTASSQSGAVRGAILLTTADAKAGLGAEGYELNVAADSVVIRASEQAGVFYGVQTLLQLLPPEVFAAQPVKNVNWTLPCVQIEDQPRFKWRGMLLDVSRHFFNKEEIKKLLDALVLNKINTFQWHLTDDQGWRIEIKKYPKLTEEGAWRKDIGFRMSPNDSPRDSTAYGPDGRYGGFYTQDDVREVVAYATARHITIVPEIEMPGHALAALSVFPEFGCPGIVFCPDPAKQPGVYNGVYCAGNDATIEFAQNVLAEVIQLFPGKYIHIGGDEAPKTNWKQCPKCQARIKAEGLKDEKQLQSYFIQRIEKFINGQGRVLVGWSEILHGGIAQNATLMDWIGGGVEAASAGHDVVMTPTATCYFDYCQGLNRSKEPYAPGVYLPVEKVYAFDPIPAKLDLQFHAHILGAQGNLWTEHVPSLKHLEYMTFPRMSALAEVTWSPQDARNWDDFNRRLQVQFQRFDQLGVNYRRETEALIGEWTPAQLTNSEVALEWDVTRQIKTPGRYQVNLSYTKGKCGLAFVSGMLLEDGREIASDVQTGFTTGGKTVVYNLDLPAPKAGARYTVRVVANVAPNCADSFGNVTWSMTSLTKKAGGDSANSSGNVSSAAPAAGGKVVIGEWTPLPDFKKPQGTPLEWNVTPQFTAAGKVQVSFNYTRGKCGLDVLWVALLEDGQEITRDAHIGFTTGGKSADYTLELPGPKAGAKYTVRAQVSAGGGEDSSGKVFWIIQPPDNNPPFPHPPVRPPALSTAFTPSTSPNPPSRP